PGRRRSWRQHRDPSSEPPPPATTTVAGGVSFARRAPRRGRRAAPQANEPCHVRTGSTFLPPFLRGIRGGGRLLFDRRLHQRRRSPLRGIGVRTALRHLSRAVVATSDPAGG